MKHFAIITLIMMTVGITSAQQSFYNLQAKTIEGETFHFSSLKGKKVLIVNVASKCGYTGQYKDLQELYLRYQDKNFVIIGFPANNFMGQEPGSNAEIKAFCTSKYQVTFPMMEKISVKGNDMHPVYQWLTQKSLNGLMDSEVKWNFQKYLIDENGNLIEVIPTRESPLSDKIVQWITGS